MLEKNLQQGKHAVSLNRQMRVQRLRRDIAWMRRDQHLDHSAARADFYRFFSEHDRRRGTDFLRTFPNMRQWWEECKSLARTSC